MAEAQRKAWTDGIGNKNLWSYSGPRFARKSHRNDQLWNQIVESRKGLIAKALGWRTAALADGWTTGPNYQHEDELTAFKLKRDGFLVQGLARPATDMMVGSGELSCWGPDGLTVPIGEIYDWDAIKRGMETCNYCGAYPIVPERVAFAGRACPECGPKERAKLPHNWSE